MHRRNATATMNMPQILWDILTVSTAYLLSAVLYHAIMGAFLGRQHFWMYLTFTVIFVLCMFLWRMYNRTTFYYYDRIILRTLYSTLVTGSVLSMVIFLLKLDTTSRLSFLFFSALSFVLVAGQRVLVRVVDKDEWTNGRTRAVFIGGQGVFEQFARFVGKTALRYRFVDTMDWDDPRIATMDDFERYVVENQIDEVLLVAQPGESGGRQDYMLACEEMGITTRVVLVPLELPVSQRYVSSIGTYPVITYHSVSLDQSQLFVKSAIDFIGAVFGLLVLSPVFLAVAIAIKVESPGPVFFRQKRAGLYGKTFRIFKFRSMYLDAEERKAALMEQNKIKDGLMFKMDNDPRITRVGAFLRKTSIDELPQLINVLRGEMSLVGTRPPTLDEVERYERHHRSRISIKPGITGMWQVSGRSDITDFEQVVSLDRQYIEQWTLKLDFQLLFRTVLVVLGQRGAS